MSARYDQTPRRGKTQQGINADSFESVTLDYLESRYRTMGVKNELVSHQRIVLVDYEAIEAVFKTDEVMSGGCESEGEKTRAVLNKYVLIKHGDWGYDFFSARGKWPAMVIHWYGSPTENFDEGISDFDRMVQSFRFVKN